MDGFLVVDKPAGRSSHDVVAIVRRLTGQRKAGHTGTLDPAATGVLVIALGRATRLIEFLDADTKAYRGEVALGVETDSYDADGKVTARSDASHLTAGQVEEALAAFRGDILQVPPMVSAKKVDGQRLYKLARTGREVEREAVPVTIERCELSSFEAGGEAVAVLEVECGAGTYIRSIAHDLGEALGVGGHLRGLRRTRVGRWTVDGAVGLDTLAALTPAEIEELLQPLEAAVAHLPSVQVTAAGVERLAYGKRLRGEDCLTPWPVDEDKLALLAEDGRLLAIAEPRGDELQPRKVLLQA